MRKRKPKRETKKMLNWNKSGNPRDVGRENNKKKDGNLQPTRLTAEDFQSEEAKRLGVSCWCCKILITCAAPWYLIDDPSAVFFHSHSTTDYDSLTVIKESLARLSSKNPPTSSSSSSSSLLPFFFPPLRKERERRERRMSLYSGSIYISIYSTSFFSP